MSLQRSDECGGPGANARVGFSVFSGLSEGSRVLFYVKDPRIHGCSSFVREVQILAKESRETRLLLAHQLAHERPSPRWESSKIFIFTLVFLAVVLNLLL